MSRERHIEADSQLPVAARADDGTRPGDVRVAYRIALLVLITSLGSLILDRGYGIDAAAAAGPAARRVSGDWVSVPWQVVGSRSPLELQLAVEASACARVVRQEVVETPNEVMVTVWRRRTHPSCVPLGIVVRLEQPVGDRKVVDGGSLAQF